MRFQIRLSLKVALSKGAHRHDLDISSTIELLDVHEEHERLKGSVTLGAVEPVREKLN